MTPATLGYGLLAAVGVALLIDGLCRMMLAHDRRQADPDLIIEEPVPQHCESRLERAVWIVLLVLLTALAVTLDLDRRAEGTPLTRATTETNGQAAL